MTTADAVELFPIMGLSPPNWAGDTGSSATTPRTPLRAPPPPRAQHQHAPALKHPVAGRGGGRRARSALPDLSQIIVSSVAYGGQGLFW